MWQVVLRTQASPAAHGPRDAPGAPVSAVRPGPERPVALVTGASRGIGRAVALRLGAEGFRLCLGARTAEALRELAQELETAGADVLAARLDVRDPGSVDAFVQAALDRFGRIDLVVANAGVGGGATFPEMAAQDIEDLVATNFLGALSTVRAALGPMLRQRSGTLVLIASVAGEVALPGSALYAATKAGLVRFAEGLRREVAGGGLKVTAILPGFVRTDMTEGLGLPMPGPEVVAEAVLRAWRRGPRRIVVPGFYRPLIWLSHLAPSLVDLVGRRILREMAHAGRR